MNETFPDNRASPEIRSAVESKQARQAAWKEHCERQGWSVAQCNQAASLIPAGATLNVLDWPAL